MWFDILLLAFGAAGILLYVYLSWHHRYWQQRGVVGPVPKLLSGSFPHTQRGEVNFVEELHAYYLQHREAQTYIGIFVAREPKLFILEPKLALEVLTTNFKNFHDNESSLWTTTNVEKLRLYSPFVSTGENWRQRRSELTPALTQNRLRAHQPTFEASSRQLVAYIAEMCKRQRQPLNVKELANRYTAQFVAQFIWSTEAAALEIDTLETGLAPVHCMAESMLRQSLRCVNYFARTASFPWLRKLWPMRFFPAECEQFFQRLAREALALREQQEQSTAHADVINHLKQLKEKKHLSDTQIAGHTTTVLIDGYETGAMLIAHCLLLLARNTRVQQRLRQELTDVGGMSPISYDALNDLPYLEQCLQETLRLFPPLPTFGKICTMATTLGDTLPLQVGDIVYISAYSLHHDERYYDAPMEFRPERFDADLGGVRKYRDLGVFLPFGDGPRMCPGMKLGLAEAKSAVAAIIDNFRISCSDDMRADNKLAPESFLLTLDGGIRLNFEPCATN